MITKDRSMKEPPKSGVKEYSVASRAPASPVKAIPTPNVSMAVRRVSMPTSCPASRFWVRARTERPNQVRFKSRCRATSERTAIPKTIRRMIGMMMPPNRSVAMVIAVRMDRSSAPQTR